MLPLGIVLSVSALRMEFEPEFDISARLRVNVLHEEKSRQELSDFIVGDCAYPVVLSDVLERRPGPDGWPRGAGAGVSGVDGGSV